MKHSSISLRAANENDIPFLWELRQHTMKPHVQNSYGWKDQEQLNYVKEHLREAQIIEYEGKDIGVIKVLEFEREFFLSQFQVHPDFSGKGIGNFLLRDLIEKAKNKNKIIRLHVIKINPARKLYEKFGFTVTTELEHQYEMTWQKPS